MSSKTITTSGHEIPRDQLHVSDYNTIYHDTLGQLCECESHYGCVLYHPIQFKSLAAARKWIDTGYIAELQESLNNLKVGFNTLCFAVRSKPHDL